MKGILILCSILGAASMATTEAEAYSKGKHLNHYLLAALRVTGAVLLITILYGKEVELSLLLAAMGMMMGVFAPTHRTMLNQVRIRAHETPIEWYHLGTESLYDRAWVWFTTQIRVTNKATRYLLLCGLELLLAGALYNQLP